MTIIVPPELEADFTTMAQTEGMSPEDYLRQLLEREIRSKRISHKSLISLYGVLAQHGPAPSAEEIEENRTEMFRSFARDNDEW